MKTNSSFIATWFLAASAAVPQWCIAQAVEPAEPFAVGTFEKGGAPTLGLVLRNALVVDLGAAGADFERSARATSMTMPDDMLELIERYDDGLRERLYAIVNFLAAGDRLEGSRPAYVHDVNAIRILAPIQYPGKIMNAAVNFYTHACEGCSEEELQRLMRERQQNRGVPYLFLKPARGAEIGRAHV